MPLKSKTLNSGTLRPYASRNPPDPHKLPSYPLVREPHGSLKQSVSLSLIGVGSVLTASVVFLALAKGAVDRHGPSSL
eukprot:1155106-Pelagomonas_calceolata.AAC.9